MIKLLEEGKNKKEVNQMYYNSGNSYTPYQNYLCHYGIKRRSGRYPWGSGKDPNQSDPNKGRRNSSLSKTGKRVGVKTITSKSLRDSKKKSKKMSKEDRDLIIELGINALYTTLLIVGTIKINKNMRYNTPNIPLLELPKEKYVRSRVIR